MVVVLLTIMCLSATALICYPFYSGAGGGTVLQATKLADKPENYTHLENPDQHILQAMSGDEVVVGVQDTVYNLISEQGPYFEVNGSYYRISLGPCVDWGPSLASSIIVVFAILGLIMSTGSLIRLLALKLAKKPQIK